jgi:hypothetical protein
LTVLSNLIPKYFSKQQLENEIQTLKSCSSLSCEIYFAVC